MAEEDHHQGNEKEDNSQDDIQNPEEDYGQGPFSKLPPPPNYTALEETLGLDTDAMEMSLDDQLPEGATENDVVNIYGTKQYLVLCRERLLKKVVKR